MHFVEDHELDIADEVGTLVEHAPQDLRRHDEARGLRVDLHIAREDAYGGRREGLLEVAELLVRQRFDGRRVDGAVRTSIRQIFDKQN